MAGSTTYFAKDFFGFLKELEKNNNREWFTKNKGRYEEEVQEPGLRFIRDLGPRLKAISPYLVANPRPFGGSMTRIYRDIRFSRDRSPYRTTVGIHLSHSGERGKMHLPGLYLHLEPGETSAGSGMWQPDPSQVKRVRDAIVRDSDAWKRAIPGGGKWEWMAEGESLKRPPPGYDPDHPFIRDLMRKDFVGTWRFRDTEVTNPDFLDTFIAAGKAMNPLNRFLAGAIELPW